jgi:oxygen-dependent protoporphyrinogen oxidase
VERREVVVVGGGLAGLTAAWELRDRDVVVLEPADRVGGRLRSESRGDVWLNFGAHVFGGPSSATGALLRAAGVEARPVPGRLAAAEMGGRVVARGPVEAMPLRLPLSPAGRVALARTGARLRLAVRRYAAVAEPRPGEAHTERQQRMLDFMDDRSMAEFLGPLPADADGLFRATLTRSSGEPEDLHAGYGVGYFHLVWNRESGLSWNILGGSAVLPHTLASALGDAVRLGVRATGVAETGEGVDVAHERADGSIGRIVARTAVVAVPAHVVPSIVPGLPDETRGALEQIPYGPYVVGSFLTDERRPMPWDGIYALATPQRSFSMLFNTANVLRGPGGPRDPGGSLMVYAAADLARALAQQDDAEIERSFRDDLFAIYPDARRVVREVVVHRWERGLPYPRPGRARLQAPLTRPLGRIHLAGDYLGTWYTETAILTAQSAAAAARAQLT